MKQELYQASKKLIDDARGPAAAELKAIVKSQLEHALDGERRGLKIYESLRNLNEVIGTQYGDRVLYELIQNAHDAHPSGNSGKIAIRLVVERPDKGTLYVANGGNGFQWKDVESIRNLGTSAKKVGEGIGNKGLGFRSTEALTNDVRIYSQLHSVRSERFDGYCFRFANISEIENLLAFYFHEATPTLRQKVATTIPRYLVPLPLTEQSPNVQAYAQSGYATVVVIPLRTAKAVCLAMEQVQGLANLDVPLLLFLDRIDEVRLDIALPEEKPFRRVLQRRQHRIGRVGSIEDSCELYQVDVGDRHRFLVVRREVEKSRVLDAVKRSLTMVPQLRRWLDWKGTPTVSIAVSLNKDVALTGRLYNFLPMSERAMAPLMGYLDAPFFADIDRRSTNLNLPLNETLLEAAAAACAASAIWIVEQQIDVPPHAVFDLVAWTGEHASKLDVALKDLGTALDKAPVIPAVAVDRWNGWSSLSVISLWPSGHYTVLKARDVVRRIGARLVSLDLGDQHIQRLKQLAVRAKVNLVPGGEQFSDWAEQFAATLLARNASARTWSQYYDDLRRLFGEVKEDLTALAHKRILLDRLGKLRAAGTDGADGQSKVFVRVEGTQRRRSPGGVPLPPRTLVRRFHFLDERISLAEETLSAFRKAGLLRVYDPIEALVGLKGVLGQKANENHRKEALVWAFQVWRLAGSRVDDALQKAGLYVPTHSGWLPAGRAAFSASWTVLGSTLENYLVEVAGFSADCRHARARPLIPYANWPEASQDSKRQWVRFLEVLGVVDGLRPIPGHIIRKGSPANYWYGLLSSGKPSEGLDDDWCAEASRVHFSYPYTDYEIRGHAWRLPGQIEHAQLSDAAKETLSSLIFEHLKVRGKAFFQFRVGRFERAERAWDTSSLPTPMATFLRSKPWLAVNAGDEIVFRRPSECWATRERRRGSGPPRFLDRLPEKFAADVAENTSLADLMFGEPIGLRDWQSEATAVARLSDLALATPDLAGADRPVFRREYQRAWLDAAGTQITFPADGSIAVTQQGRLEILEGCATEPREVMVAQDNRSFEARVLSAARRAVLEVGEAPVKKIMALLEASKGFAPRQLDGVGVQLLVDGDPFAPSATDPLLISMGLEWLPDVVMVSHELRGEQLERGIARSTLENRTRAIRVRRCKQISLVVDDEEISPGQETPFYAFEHEALPTLIVTDAVVLSWRTLGNILLLPIMRLIDGRLRSLEPVLLRLALDRQSDDLEAPSEEALARVLECDVETIREHLLALRTDTDRVLYILLPVVAYYGGVDAARRMQSDADRLGPRFDVKGWLANNVQGAQWSADELLQACERAGDRADIRRILELDYRAFNQALVALGEQPLSNEPELRRLYDAYRRELKPALIDRLRRHHLEDFRQGRDLDQYVERRELSFLTFDQDWVLMRESLEREVVEQHVWRLLQETLGDDSDVELPPLNRILEANRKTAQRFVEEAMPLVRAWCRKHEVAIPAPWDSGGPQAAVRLLEGKGLLDFEMLTEANIAGLCRRAGCWPDDMEETLDRTAVGLEESDVRMEERHREEERKRAEITRRTIHFAGTALDTGDVNFAQNLKGIAEVSFAADDTWFDRSSHRVRLATFSDVGGKTGGISSGGTGARRSGSDRNLTEAQRIAMGMASEWLAYQYLCRRHIGYVDEDSWVSENRWHFFGSSKGYDAAGYDFRVETPQAEWLYEVKSTLEDSGEFEITANELRIASSASKDGRRRYRILYVPYVFSPDKWCVLELPNPMGEKTRNRFETIGRGSVRLRFARW